MALNAFGNPSSKLDLQLKQLLRVAEFEEEWHIEEKSASSWLAPATIPKSFTGFRFNPTPQTTDKLLRKTVALKFALRLITEADLAPEDYLTAEEALVEYAPPEPLPPVIFQEGDNEEGDEDEDEERDEDEKRLEESGGKGKEKEREKEASTEPTTEAQATSHHDALQDDDEVGEFVIKTLDGAIFSFVSFAPLGGFLNFLFDSQRSALQNLDVQGLFDERKMPLWTRVPLCAFRERSSPKPSSENTGLMAHSRSLEKHEAQTSKFKKNNSSVEKSSSPKEVESHTVPGGPSAKTLTLWRSSRKFPPNSGRCIGRGTPRSLKCAKVVVLSFFLWLRGGLLTLF